MVARSVSDSDGTAPGSPRVSCCPCWVPWLSWLPGSRPRIPWPRTGADQFLAPSLRPPVRHRRVRARHPEPRHPRRAHLAPHRRGRRADRRSGRACRSGSSGGFAGGLADAAIMRVLDFLLAVPGDPARHGHHRHPGARLVQRHARGRRGEHPLVRAPDARQHALAQGAGVRRGDPRARRGPRVPHVPDDPAQRADAHRGPGRGDRRGGDAPRGGALLPRARHPAARPPRGARCSTPAGRSSTRRRGTASSPASSSRCRSSPSTPWPTRSRRSWTAGAPAAPSAPERAA